MCVCVCVSLFFSWDLVLYVVSACMCVLVNGHATLVHLIIKLRMSFEWLCLFIVCVFFCFILCAYLRRLLTQYDENRSMQTAWLQMIIQNQKKIVFLWTVIRPFPLSVNNYSQGSHTQAHIHANRHAHTVHAHSHRRVFMSSNVRVALCVCMSVHMPVAHSMLWHRVGLAVESGVDWLWQL